MKKILLAACCLLPAFSYAQNSNLDFYYALKGSGTFTHMLYNDYIMTRKSNIIKPSLSLLIKNRHGNFHEIELTDAGMGKYKSDVNSQISTSTGYHFGIHYQYVQNFLKHTNSRWMPAIAFGITALSGYNKFQDIYPDHSDTRKTLALDLAGIISPQISYSFSKKFFMTFSVPITVVDSYSWFAIGESDKNNVFEAFPSRWSLKLGLGLKL